MRSWLFCISAKHTFKHKSYGFNFFPKAAPVETSKSYVKDDCLTFKVSVKVL